MSNKPKTVCIVLPREYANHLIELLNEEINVESDAIVYFEDGDDRKMAERKLRILKEIKESLADED